MDPVGSFCRVPIGIFLSDFDRHFLVGFRSASRAHRPGAGSISIFSTQCKANYSVLFQIVQYRYCPKYWKLWYLWVYDAERKIKLCRLSHLTGTDVNKRKKQIWICKTGGRIRIWNGIKMESQIWIPIRIDTKTMPTQTTAFFVYLNLHLLSSDSLVAVILNSVRC